VKAGVSLWHLHVRWRPPLALGNQTAVVRLATTGPGGQGAGRPVEVKVIASGVPDVAATPTRLVFPRPDEPTPELATVEIETRLAGQRLRVVDGAVRGEGAAALALEFAPLDPDGDRRATRIQVRLTLDPERAPPAFAGTVTVEFENEAPLEIPYVRLARSCDRVAHGRVLGRLGADESENGRYPRSARSPTGGAHSGASTGRLRPSGSSPPPPWPGQALSGKRLTCRQPSSRTPSRICPARRLPAGLGSTGGISRIERSSLGSTP